MSNNGVPSFKTPEALATIERIKTILVREAARDGATVAMVAQEVGLAEGAALNYLRHMGRKELAHMRVTRRWMPGPAQSWASEHVTKNISFIGKP